MSSMKNQHIVILCAIGVILLVGFSIAVCAWPKPKAWVMVGEWKGTDFWNLNLDYNDFRNNNVTTQQFRIMGDEWRVSWESPSRVVGNHFDIKVFDDYTGEVLKEIITSENGEARTSYGESYLNTQGRYHLQIFIMGELPGWHVQVEEYK